MKLGFTADKALDLNEEEAVGFLEAYVEMMEPKKGGA